jgi:hypothetical protein
MKNIAKPVSNLPKQEIITDKYGVFSLALHMLIHLER